ncbi:MAG: glycosyltransferase [Phenylobacterium sp.]|uniref:glycosyltransferase n=1 Tax=Phenylobacterium sp. TaxID=1871053 RepID=UPI00301A12C6
MADYVFHDPSGRRARRAGRVAGGLGALLILLGAGFFATLAIAPKLPRLDLRDPRALTSLHQETSTRVSRLPPAWTRIPRAQTAVPGSQEPRPLRVGFYVSWDPTARESLARHVQDLDVIAPQWIALKGDLGEVSVTADPQADAIITAAARRPAVMPVVFNAEDGKWDGTRAGRLIESPAARRRLVDGLAALARARGYAGFVFDLENLSPRAAETYPLLLAEAKQTLSAQGCEVWVTAPADDPAWPLRRLQDAAGVLVLMLYDQHYVTGDPGPPAGQAWFQQQLASAMSRLSASRTVLALGAYGYDWALPSRGQKTPEAGAVTFAEATQAAYDSGAQATMDSATLNPTFGYEDETGRRHQVWFLDAPTLFNEIRVADPFRPLGYGLWRMGSEDPDIWGLLNHGWDKATPAGLETIPPGQDVDFDGRGEVLKVTATPTAGERTLAIDPASGLVAGETYVRMPTSYVIQRYGFHPGRVALTFDDGPDRRWTPKILDILKAKKAPATFFVIGENMERYPDLVQREVREGHTVGNHTWTHPNVGETPQAQTEIELSATQRLFETLTTRSMRLFRPPYFGDAEPSTAREVAPLLLAQSQGYLTAGLRIDPDDWKKPDPDHIVSETLNRLSQSGPRAGQVVLLHDSGGDRSRTVMALPRLIDALRAQGYTLVSLDHLADMTRDQAMPAASRGSLDLWLDRLGFGFVHGAEVVLETLFLTAIVLGVARLAFLGGLALVHRLRDVPRAPPPVSPEAGPRVTVLIPCYNEERVVVASVERILKSDWVNLEVLVLDDGSTDGTVARIVEAFPDHPRVRLLTFANGGKARALNRGLVLASGEIVVALDADTQFAPDAVSKLVRWFADPKVGAVAGNAIVGNRVNLVTRWQALEYVTAQNLERRALAALGAVTVVPGAVGAWRRQALEALGGYPADTLAEDQDLTLAVQRAGWKVAFDPDARAYTEAPDTVQGLMRQRYRWSFGTLQCLWKHRAGLFDVRRPVLGFVALPQIWVFQILLTVIAPLVDLALIWSLVAAAYGRVSHPAEWSPDDILRPIFYWTAFVLLDLSAGVLAMALEDEAPWRDLPLLPLQRFGYRQLMYAGVLRSLSSAIRGARVAWGRLERRGSVRARSA